MLKRLLLIISVIITLSKTLFAQDLTNLYFFYQPECNGCHKVNEHVMPADSAGKYIDEHFNLIKINAAAEESWPLLDKYGVSQTPTFLFMDENNKPLIKVVNSKFTAKSFMKKCEEVRTLGSLRKKYDAKIIQVAETRTLVSLYERLSPAGDTTYFPIARDYFTLQNIKQLNTNENRELIYILAAKHPLIVTLGSNAYQVLLNNREVFYKEYSKDQVDARICWVATLTNDLAIVRGDSNLFNTSLKVLALYKSGHSIVLKDATGKTLSTFTMPHLLNKQLAYWLSNDTSSLNRWEQQQMAKTWSNTSELTLLINIYLELFPNDTTKPSNKHLLFIENLSERAIAIEDTYENNFNRALVLQRLGMKPAAISTAQRALSMGKANNINVSKITALLEELQKP